MHFSTLLVSAIALVASAANLVAADTCKTTCVRQEYRALSPSQKTAYFSAVNKLMESGQYHKYVRLHLDNARAVHGTPQFFVWHRAFTRNFEQALQAIDPSVCLPYWSWDFDSQAPEASPLLTDEYLGGNGDSRTSCATLPWAPNWMPQHPRPHCLKRQFDGGNPIGSFYSTELINGIIRSSSDYDDFRQQIEGAPHSTVHTGIGGDTGDMSNMSSPNDPIFWAHHANIDRIYALWQQARPDLAKTYGGQNERGRDVSEGDQLFPFPLKVRDIYNTKDLCYTYADLPASLGNRAHVPPPKFQPQSDDSSNDNVDDTSFSLKNAAVPRPSVVPTFANQARPSPPTFNTPHPAPQTSDSDVHHHRGLREFFHGIAHGHLHRRADTTPVTVSPMPRGAEAYSAYDRTNLISIRYPKPVPESFLRNNWIDVSVVRGHETKYVSMISQINSIEGYVSPVALLNRHDLWAHLSAEIHEFSILLRNIGKITFGLAHEDLHQGLSNIKEMVKEHIHEHKHITKEEIYNRLVSIIGEPVYENANSATTFVPGF